MAADARRGYVFGPRLQGFFRFSIDLQAGFLVVNSIVDDGGNRSVQIGQEMSTATCIRYVREALGDPDIGVEIESIQRWSASAEYAERLRDGRVFLAGDGAHVMPPTGGFGGNVGIQDGYDLAWKLAYVLDGRAGPGLLATYDAERQPVGAFSTEQAYTRYVLRLDPALGTDDLMPIVDEAAIELGYRYRSDAVADEPDDDGAMWDDPRATTGRPGFRAPHLSVKADGAEESTLDLFGRSFVLLAGPQGDSWCTAARTAADAFGVPMRTYRLGAELTDRSGQFETAYGTGQAGAVLVRPDGFVAWRASAPYDDPERTMGEALGRALARTGVA